MGAVPTRIDGVERTAFALLFCARASFCTVGENIRQEADGMLQRVGNGQKQTMSGEKRGEKVRISTRLPAWGFACRS